MRQMCDSPWTQVGVQTLLEGLCIFHHPACLKPFCNVQACGAPPALQWATKRRRDC
jgi:hypothetical protein